MAKTKHVLLVMSNSADGRDQEYNDWYTNVHVPDVLRVPGFVSAQRYKLDAKQRGGNAPAQWQYMATYDIETDSIEGTLAELGRRARTPEMPVPDCIKDTWAYLYTPITPPAKK